MGEVIKVEFPHFEQGWVCGCGSCLWMLYADGKCFCAGCDCYSTKIKIVEGNPDEST